MPVQLRTLNVLPNPWLYIDHKGLPVGRVGMEANANGVPETRHVGASRPKTVRTSEAPAGAPLAQPIDEIVEIEWASKPVAVRNTEYYRRQVMCGDLIAADHESFVAAGGRASDFEDYAQHIEAKRKAAIEQFDIENGAGAFVALTRQREDDAMLRAKVEASIAAQRGESEPEPVADKPAKVNKPEGQKGSAPQ